MTAGTGDGHPTGEGKRQRTEGTKRTEEWKRGAAGGGLPPRGGGSELGEGALEGDLSGVIEGQAAGGVEEPGEIAR